MLNNYDNILTMESSLVFEFVDKTIAITITSILDEGEGVSEKK